MPLKKEVLEKVVNELRLQTVGRTKLHLEETITKWATRRGELEAQGVCFFFPDNKDGDDDKKKDDPKKDDPKKDEEEG